MIMSVSLGIAFLVIMSFWKPTKILSRPRLVFDTLHHTILLSPQIWSNFKPSICVYVCVHMHAVSCVWFFVTPRMVARSSVHGIFQANSTEVGCSFLLQWIFLTQGKKLTLLCLLHCQVDFSFFLFFFLTLLRPPGKT